jgi:hypothetical protein
LGTGVSRPVSLGIIEATLRKVIGPSHPQIFLVGVVIDAVPMAPHVYAPSLVR